MVDIVRPVFGEVWASSGEKLAPEATKIQSGWVQEMMPYQYENFLVNRQDVVITYLLQKGVAEWDVGQEYIGNKSTVMYMGALYVAATTSTGILPTNTTAWRRISTISSADGVISIMGGGTGASTAANARVNLGLGTMSTQNANLVDIAGGSINATPIGATTRSTGAFTSVNATGNITASSFTGPSTGDVTGNASSATILQTARTIGLSGGVTGTPTSFNGSSNIVIPITAVDATSLTGTASISTTGNAATATALQTPRTITLSGAATATPTTFNGGSNITIPVTALNATNLTTGDVPEARMSLNAVTKTSATGSAKIPAGSTAQRDVSPTLGAQRFNTTTGLQEYWNGSAWVSFTGVALDSLVENYPTIRPTLNLDFVNSDMVDPRVTFTRTSTATYHDAKGVLQTVPANVPRIDYDPMTGECKGLLIEEQRVRLNFVSAAPTVAESITVTAVAHTVSFYGNGSIALSGAHTETVSGTGASPTRTTLTFTPTSGTLTITPSGSVQHLQVEAGAFATSVILGEGSQVTRDADNASMTGENFSGWYRQDAFTLTADVSPIGGVDSHAVSISDSFDQRALALQWCNGLGTLTKNVETFLDSTSYSPAGSRPDATSGSRLKLAGSFAVGGVASNSVDGDILVGTLVIPGMPEHSALRFGKNASDLSLTAWTGHIRRVSGYPIALDPSQLQTITT